MARNATARAESERARAVPRNTKRSTRRKFQIDEHCVASSAATSTLRPDSAAEGGEGERIDRDAADADQAEAAEARAGRAEPEAPDDARGTARLPAPTPCSRRRAARRSGTGSRTPRAWGERTRISSRILKPLGRRAARSSRVAPDEEEAGQRIADANAGGTGTRRARARRAKRETSLRSGLSPAIEPPSRKREATTRSLLAASAWARSCSIASGGCCRSASMTQTHGARAAAIPATTAPPRPPSRSPGSRWMIASSSPTLPARSATTSRRLVVRVVDHDELGVHAGEGIVESIDEGAYDVLLVARRARRSSVPGFLHPSGASTQKRRRPHSRHLALQFARLSLPRSLLCHVGVRPLVWSCGSGGSYGAYGSSGR